MAQEPFRLFFPAATLAGLIGVLLWPSMIAGWMTDYPGERHARLMIHGFFGGFVLGFLGTSLPRFLEVAPLRRREVFPLLAVFLCGGVAHTLGATGIGDALFILQLVSLPVFIALRWNRRRDMPPPGFVLVLLGLLSGIGGVLVLHTNAEPDSPSPALLGKLLAYHGFVVLCILGAGGFLLPRFLGVGPRRKIATALSPDREWRRAMRFAGATGLAVIATYLLEASGRSRSAATLRACLVIGYFARELPIERLRWKWKGVHWLLICGLVFLPIGILTAGWLYGFRIAFSHFELVGGFGLITVGVAAQVVLGHTGQRRRLEGFNGWLTTAGALMLVGMLTRISADLIPGTMISHYLYGALCWAGGLAIWAACVLRHVFRPDPEAG
jgi:uncharacterized protein involved in response to NO